MTIAIAVTHNEGFGDYVFALKYAAELRRKIDEKTGEYEEVLIELSRKSRKSDSIPRMVEQLKN